MNPQAILIAHLPLLRLERSEDLRLGDGLLTRLPDLELDLISAFHTRLVDPVWAALGLAAPAGILPPPRSSMTFLLPVGDSHLEIDGQALSGVRLQGDADMELAFLPDAAHAPLDHTSHWRPLGGDNPHLAALRQALRLEARPDLKATLEALPAFALFPERDEADEA